MSRARMPTHRLALRDFLHDEAAGGVVLVVGALPALVCANSSVSDSRNRGAGRSRVPTGGPPPLLQRQDALRSALGISCVAQSGHGSPIQPR